MSGSRIIAMKIVDEISLGKMTGDLGLTDWDPLVTIMYIVAAIIERRGGSFDKPKARKVWLQSVADLQADNSRTEHNICIPCRYCDQAFQPVIDDQLLALFLAWYRSQTPDELLSIHRCNNCGGQLKSSRIERYEGDMHTPKPGAVLTDKEWCDSLLRYAPL